MAGSPTTTRQEHHDLSLAVWTRQGENIARLKKVIISSMNPMKYEGEDLPNIITTAVMPAEMQNDVCNQEDIGQQKYANFVEKRINTNEVSIWGQNEEVSTEDMEKCKEVGETQSGSGAQGRQITLRPHVDCCTLTS